MIAEVLALDLHGSSESRHPLALCFHSSLICRMYAAHHHGVHASRRWTRYNPRGTLSSAQAIPPSFPLGRSIRTLQVSDLKHDAAQYQSSASISECTHVGSFNWLDATEPTIVVPGMPAQWQPLKKPRRLQPDGGQYFRDRNAARFPQHPLEPAVLAALNLDSQLNIDEGIDVVLCASTFGNLARFARGGDKAFRMLVEEVGGTVFFTRRENSPKELIPDVMGYGHTFPEAYTNWNREVKSSASHQRLIKYRFGGLTILLRYEADGFLPDKVTTGGIAAPVVPGADPYCLVQGVNEVHVSSLEPANNQTLKIKYAGSVVGEEAIFDLKTRSARKADDDILGGELPRLWVTQVPNFVVAFHKSGLFDDIRILDARGRISTWEKDNAEGLAALAVLMRVIMKQVKDRSDGKIELCHSTPGKLEIREQLPDAGHALSSAVESAWTARGLERKVKKREVAVAAVQWDEDEDEGDLTACSEACGYCGRCT
ncbi:geranylgeranyl pyrophosphate synthetase [Microdochium trichocladiopsis]|uniref:Geranylgeranyl pyrophosphate synthetase n=1 Tax=Microdochium trichocladiopsis TaxID=1682393 RepID=A0A9P9BMC0_9PEZI|nr:geranylgeranyl pyrophosphate synthetase [Microdochium trichocladiopsis]KAH7026128.1 geranylgeranyl pyrophosphate synthetase [Microdochium trichocladiopsis]